MINKLVALSRKKYGFFGWVQRISQYGIKHLINIPILIVLQARRRYRGDSATDIRLIGERPHASRDNGYHMFVYLRTHHPEIPAYYVIQPDSPDLHKIKHLGNIIAYGSIEHKKKFLEARVILSTHFGFVEPLHYPLYNKIFASSWGKKHYVFLQHGVIYNDLSELLHRDVCGFDLVLTSAQAEYDDIRLRYGYDESQIALTGLARYDALHPHRVISQTQEPQSQQAQQAQHPRQIVWWPTWRSYLSGVADISHSEYIQGIQGVLDSEQIQRLLEEHDYTLIYYPHYELTRHLHQISSDHPRIIIADPHTLDIQQALTSCSICITDYSSILFDIGYMYTPCIYYQYDAHRFFDQHYQAGYFDIGRDGFGPVASTLDELAHHLQHSLRHDALLDQTYRTRVDEFFAFFDDRNCERIVAEIRLML